MTGRRVSASQEDGSTRLLADTTPTEARPPSICRPRVFSTVQGWDHSPLCRVIIGPGGGAKLPDTCDARLLVEGWKRVDSMGELLRLLGFEDSPVKFCVLFLRRGGGLGEGLRSGSTQTVKVYRWTASSGWRTSRCGEPLMGPIGHQVTAAIIIFTLNREGCVHISSVPCGVLGMDEHLQAPAVLPPSRSAPKALSSQLLLYFFTHCLLVSQAVKYAGGRTRAAHLVRIVDVIEILIDHCAIVIVVHFESIDDYVLGYRSTSKVGYVLDGRLVGLK